MGGYAETVIFPLSLDMGLVGGWERFYEFRANQGVLRRGLGHYRPAGGRGWACVSDRQKVQPGILPVEVRAQ